MTWLVLTEESPGAPRNSGTNGDLCALLDWALPQAGWAIEHTATNARVYRPGAGNRHRLYVQHDSTVSGNAGLAVVRGCEAATSATALVDPFPLVAQSANNVSNWIVSNSASTVSRRFYLYVSDRAVYYFSNWNGSADTWDFGFFGDVGPNAWDTICIVRNSSSATISANMQQTCSPTSVAGGNFVFWVRDITGATKSSRGALYVSGTQLSSLGGAPGARGGFQNRIYREKVGVNDGASTTTTPSTLGLPKRGWMPNAWNPLHSTRGSVSETDTFTDSAYSPSASFRMLYGGATGLIMEETDTWSAP